MAAAQLTVRANAEPSDSCVRAWGFHFKGLGWLCPCGSAACDGCLSLRLILLPVCSVPFTASRSGISEPLTLSRHPCRDCPATPCLRWLSETAGRLSSPFPLASFIQYHVDMLT